MNDSDLMMWLLAVAFLIGAIAIFVSMKPRERR